jgi:hypothetical protein
VFLDGSKEPNRLKYLIDSGFWDVKAVHLVRDGRGFAYSRVRRLLKKWPGLKNRRTIIRKAAVTWRRVNEACQLVLAGLPREAWVRIRYEDLCRDPQATLLSVFGLIGERPPSAPDDFRSIDHHILGNVMRLGEGRIALDEGWHTGLSAEELELYDEVAGELNRSMGYV